ncbi:MAG: hypothetical protein A2741_00600 [Candidatus Zambryskibacteria bacterium RIFCSPHIGHO2_01_FULL_43_27]|uniref:Adenine phosphoribosyltransferase n=1 Tax=Candidatus Zambryskibacteria bacterium RIFCSPLOWO2_01_FULL_43_17 TaxID=1802760 RepID=A0A1G2U3N1_9BACT|nr:MAG: hypothetical protein A2741_00600 [Candidatus Zambryskibacteria bacterium RIFCSPHIGHO2_01_FULL_43_27]OHA99640.1 MAG: hypothetical protein A3E93_00720 [Candidatus Zambryskibacteria bacterium RIFCSPHIGHO2_12_FULL_43_12b]OHB04127.1 MAG: hypothetical protein A2920_02195 [Candidatus Zambryskibacteria bacterium RIFCSPLOWO2_01_FULL_43_17]
MSSYFSVFPRRPVFLPVVHVSSSKQALQNADIAFDRGADGIFLINHDVSGDELLETFHVIKEHHAGWVGINFLDLSPGEAVLRLPRNASGLWVDKSGVKEIGGVINDYELRQWYQLRHTHSIDALYFGGVAFKYQPAVSNLVEVAHCASRSVDVVVTSGEGTGKAPDVNKIRLIRSGIGRDGALAVASGINSQNIHRFIGLVDCFLIATGISKSHTELDPIKVTELVRRLNVHSQ